MSFALGWFYWYLWTILFPTECSAVAILFGYWLPDVNAAAWIVIALVVCTILNSFSVRVYGESEFWFVSIASRQRRRCAAEVPLGAFGDRYVTSLVRSETR